MHFLTIVGLAFSLPALAAKIHLERSGRQATRRQRLAILVAAVTGMWLATIGLALASDSAMSIVFTGVLALVVVAATIGIIRMWMMSNPDKPGHSTHN